QAGEFGPMRISRSKDNLINYYKTLSLGRTAQADVLISAVRRNGLERVVVPDSGGTVLANSLTLPDLDVIDLCAIGSEESPFAVAALGIERSIYLFRDILNDCPTLTLRFTGFEGVAYRILSAGD